MRLKTSPSPDGTFRRARRAALVWALASALTLAACGGADSPATQQAAAPAATTTVPTTTAPATTTPPTTASTPTATTPPTTTTTPPPPPPATTRPASTTRPSPPPAAPAATRKPAGPASHAIDETGQLKLDHSPGIGNYYETGTISGTFDGTMTLHAQIKTKGVVVSFTAQIPGGSVSGKGLAIISIVGAALDPLKGTASISGGTGKYANARGSGLSVTGKAALDGSRAIVHLTGNVTY